MFVAICWDTDLPNKCVIQHWMCLVGECEKGLGNTIDARSSASASARAILPKLGALVQYYHCQSSAGSVQYYQCSSPLSSSAYMQNSFEQNNSRTHVQRLGGTPSMRLLVEVAVQVGVVVVKDAPWLEESNPGSGCGVLSLASGIGPCSIPPSVYKYSPM